MKDSKIRWTGFTWNFFTGCTEISPGCDHCYARVIAESPRFKGAFPNGFDPTFKAHKLKEPRKIKTPQFCFVNSMSDFCHKDFTDEQRDAAMDEMLLTDRHIYQILTKRAQALPRYVRGWLQRKGLQRVPKHIWFGVTIESNEYRHRADFLREVPGIRFLSCEPMIAPIPDLNLDGIHWLITGGESGNGSSDFRPMPHEWPRELLIKARATKFFCDILEREVSPSYYFKQSSGYRTETGMELDDVRIEEYPFYPSGLSADEHGAVMAEVHRLAEEKRVAALSRKTGAAISADVKQRILDM